jgi:dolichyl-phosphate beta-glucosyltransferase
MERQLRLAPPMPSDPDLSIVIPAYNEEAPLEPTLHSYFSSIRLRGMRFELIVVDNGSVDGTAALVDRLAESWNELGLIRLGESRGEGYASRSGVVNTRGRLVLFAGADGATPPQEFERVHAPIVAGAVVAVGSRMQTEEVQVQARLHRRLIGRGFHALVVLCGVPGVADTRWGFKLFRGSVAHALFSRMRTSGFSFHVEVLVMARLCGCRIAELAVNWMHQHGCRVNLVTDSAKMGRDLLVIRMRRGRGIWPRPI